MGADTVRSGTYKMITSIALFQLTACLQNAQDQQFALDWRPPTQDPKTETIQTDHVLCLSSNH